MKQTLYRYARPFQGEIREGIIIQLQSHQGHIGWGEVAPLPGFSHETIDEALEDLIKGGKSFLPSVQWGQSAALLDLIDPLEIESIPIRKLHREKIKIGHLSLKEALEKVGRSEAICVDMNQNWTLKDALDLAKQCPHLKLFEEPLKVGESQKDFPYPVALDESLRQKKRCDYPHVKAHIIKPTLHGYPLPKKVKGVDFILSSSYESEIGIYQIAKLAYRLKIPLIPMGLGTCHLFEESLFEESPRIENGKLYFPKKWSLKMGKIHECI